MLWCCCGLDVHRDMVEACILKGDPGEEHPQTVRQQFSTLRSGLKDMVHWLESNECYHIAMESTGVYWRPVYETIESCSEYIENIVVVNAHHMKNLPGRKTDVKDAEWIATLFRHGLLEKSFVAPRNIRDLREHARLRRTFIQERSRYANRLEKFLQSHGFKFTSVMSDILCVSGKSLLYRLRDAGKITPEDVADCCKRLRKPLPCISDAVCGEINNAEQHCLKVLLRKIETAESDIQDLLKYMRLLSEEFESQLKIIDSIPGIDEASAMEIIAEISDAPQDHFKSSDRLVSWAGLSPRNDESAGKIKSSATLHGNPHIKSLLCQNAWVSVKARNSHFKSWFWSRQARIGRKKAIIAVSRKILTLIYFLLSHKELYQMPA